MAVLAVATVAVHWPVLGAKAVSFDDRMFVDQNPLVRNPGPASAARFLAEVRRPSTVPGSYIPLSMISLMADYGLGARTAEPLVFHLTNLALHVGAVLCLFLFVFFLLGEALPAALAALLFALHPLTVEPVAWITERKTLLSSFFAFASLAAWAACVRAGRGRGRLALFGLSLLLYVLGILAKPTTILLPLLLPVLDWWPLGRPVRASLVEKVPFFAAMAAFALITYASHRGTAGFVKDTPYAAAQVPLLVLHNLGFYLEKIAWPARLASVYELPSPFSPASGVVAVRLALLALFVAAAAALLLRRTRSLAAGAILFVVAILPVLGLVRYGWMIVADKYAYFPLAGLALPLAALAGTLWRRRPGDGRLGGRRVALLLPALLAAVCLAAATRAQLSYWRDSRTLVGRMLALAPGSFHVKTLAGLTFAETGSTDEALAQQQQALALAPDVVQVRFNYALALDDAGRTDEAIAQYTLIIAGKPDHAESHSNLGGIYYRLGRPEEAIAEFKKAIALKPELVPAHFNLGLALLAAGRREEAIAQLKRVLEIVPGHARAREKLAQLGVAP